VQFDKNRSFQHKLPQAADYPIKFFPCCQGIRGNKIPLFKWAFLTTSILNALWSIKSCYLRLWEKQQFILALADRYLIHSLTLAIFARGMPRYMQKRTCEELWIQDST
jgi:hypothetical protein